MRKLIVIFTLAALTVSSLFAQNKEKDARLFREEAKTRLENKEYIIDNGDIVMTRVIDNLSFDKSELFLRVKNFIARGYVDGKSVVQTEDKENGLIISKGTFSEFDKLTMTYLIKYPIYFSADHILRVDIKDNKIRAIISVSKTLFDFNHVDKINYTTSEYLPFTDKHLAVQKIKFYCISQAGISLLNHMTSALDELEQVVSSGALRVEDTEW
jgi:hypothetical protein